MDTKKRDNMVKIIQSATVIIYVLLVLKSTVGEYVKVTKKQIKAEAKRKEKLKKAEYKSKKRELKRKLKKRNKKAAF